MLFTFLKIIANGAFWHRNQRPPFLDQFLWDSVEMGTFRSSPQLLLCTLFSLLILRSA